VPEKRPPPRRKSRRRKPLQARAQATVAAILAAAAQFLARAGWAGFTTNAVAARAGVSIGSLYEYFPDKQAIADALVNGHLDRGEALIAAQAAHLDGPSVAPPDLVGALVQGFVALHADDPRLHRVLSAEVPLSPAVRRRVEALNQAIVAAVATALGGRVTDPHRVARLMTDAADALTHRWIVDAGGTPLDHTALAAELNVMLSAYLALRVRPPSDQAAFSATGW